MGSLLYADDIALLQQMLDICTQRMVIPGTLFLIQLKASYLLYEGKIHP